MNEWRELRTAEEVVAALQAGEQVQEQWSTESDWFETTDQDSLEEIAGYIVNEHPAYGPMRYRARLPAPQSREATEAQS